MSDKKLAMENINNALSDLSQGNDNKAMSQLSNAQSNYDGMTGSDMDNIFNAKGIYGRDVALTLLKSYQRGEGNRPTAKSKAICQKNLDYLNRNKAPLVHLPDSFTPTYKMKPMNHKELTNLAKGMKRTVQYPPHAYKMIAESKDRNPDLKGENINFALRSTVNYCIQHHQQGVLKKHHLANARSVMDAVSNWYGKDTQERISKQMKNIHSIGALPKILDVVKVHNPTSENITVGRPTVKDVQSTVQDIHDNMYPNRKLTHKHSFSNRINHLSNRKHTYVRAHQSSNVHRGRNKVMQAQKRNQGMER